MVLKSNQKNKNNNHNKHIVIMEMKKVKTNQMNRNANIKCIGQTKPKKIEIIFHYIAMVSFKPLVFFLF